jgi:TolA-binding protein
VRPPTEFAFLLAIALPAAAGAAAALGGASGGATPASDGDVAHARGVDDAVSSPDDETETTGSATHDPGSPSWASLLVALPLVGGVALAAVAAGRGGGSEASSEDPPPPPAAQEGGSIEATGGPTVGSAPPSAQEGAGPSADAGDAPLRGLSTGGDLPGPDDPADVEAGVPRLLRLGKEAVDQGDLEDAVEWFETAIAAEPDLAVAHLCRGLSLDEMGDHEDAAEAFRAAAENDPGHVAARYLLSRNLAEAGQRREALVHLRQVVDHVPELGDLAREDEGFSSLQDDPRFHAALGDL